MAVASIQDRTAEFKSVLTQVQKRQASSKVGAQRRSLLTDAQKADANGNGKSEVTIVKTMAEPFKLAGLFGDDDGSAQAMVVETA